LTEGELAVVGRDVTKDQREIKSRLGVVPQEDNLDPDLSVLENLLVYARYFDIPQEVAEERAWDGLRLFQLQDKVKETINHLSGGLKRRLTIVRALMNEPELLVLDEPTTGLDPQARHLVWQKLRQLKQQGITMLLTTHYMEEAARLCDRLVIFDSSKIIASGTPGELIVRHAGNEVLEVRTDNADRDAVMANVQALSNGYELEEHEDTIYLFGGDSDSRMEELDLSGLEALGSEVIARRASLEDVFLRLTGRGLIE
ncbi:MAG TPA: ATP-binding cassette domain-containing protein, partial [Dehalococcoidia bacterium]|nr:ATP-binding cassette domain-containing protein [Dehalococcoidia bacterium]